MDRRTFLFLSLAVLFVMACSTVGGLVATPTPPPTPTETPSPTVTPSPTATLKPTFTPDVAATQRYDDILTQVERFKEAGHIPTTKGKYIELPEYHKEWAQRQWSTREWYYDYEPESFVFTAHAKWSTAGPTSETSGCGIAFATQDDGRGYGIFLDKARIFFAYYDLKYYYELGKTRGSGRLDFGNPAEAKFSLAVHDYKAYVYVDDVFIGEYSLSKDKPLQGYFGYGLISGTNKDYGTRCDITEPRLWQISP
jgi:hypothetical protein